MFGNFDIQLSKFMFHRDKELFLELADKMCLMVLILEKNGCIKYFNQCAATFHNWDTTLPLIGYNYEQLCQLLEIDVSSFLKDIPFISDGKIIEGIEAKINTPKANYYLLMSAIALEDLSILIVGQNITASKMKEITNHELTSYLPGALKYFPIHFFWKDTNSVFMGGDEGFKKVAGLSHLEEIKGLTDFDCPWKKHEAQKFISEDKLVYKTHQPRFNIIEETTLADKVTYQVLVSKVPLFSEDNQLIGEMGIFSKLTDAAQNKLAFFMANDVLKESIIPKNRKYCLPSPHDNMQKVYLSLREKQCLELWAMGKTSKEIARYLGISYRTVEIYINNIKQKLNLYTRSSLTNFYLTYQGVWSN